MHKIPQKILTFFIQNDPLAEKSLLAWLSGNKVEELNCSRLQVPSSQIVKIAEIIAKSSVHTVDFSGNKLSKHGSSVATNLTGEHSKVRVVNFSENNLGVEGIHVAANLVGEYSKVLSVDFSKNALGTYCESVAMALTQEHSKVRFVDFSETDLHLCGPSVAAILTREHSQVQVVNFSRNNLGKQGPLVAASLTGKHSRVLMVDFTENNCAEHEVEMIKNLTGRYSKIIYAKGIKIPDEQLKKNIANFLMEYPALSRNSLTESANERYKMHKIPQEILMFFIQNDFLAEERLFVWLSENKVEELNCSRLQVPSSQIVKIAETIAMSSVHTVDFSKNELGIFCEGVADKLTQEHSKVRFVDFSENGLYAYGPSVAAILTREHSQVQIVNFSRNNLGKQGPLVAANLTGKHSRVLMVDFTENNCAENELEMVKNLTGRYSKIIYAKGIKMPDEQLKKNIANFLMEYPALSRDSLTESAFEACYKAAKVDMSDKSLTHYIALLLSQGQTKGIMAMEQVNQMTETFRTLIFSERRASNNECNQERTEANKQTRATVPEQAALGSKNDECNCPFL